MSAIHCPYCNTDISVSSSDVATSRITCPFCQDSFTNPGLSETEGITEQQNSTPNNNPFEKKELPKNNSILTLRIVLLVMGLMAIACLIFAVLTREDRRKNDIKKVEIADAESKLNNTRKVFSPHQLPLIKLIPKNTDIIIGFHIKEMNSTTQGKVILQAINNKILVEQDIRLEDFIGVKLKNIEHAVIAVRFKKNSIPDLFLFLKTIDPYSEDSIRKVVGMPKEVKPLNYLKRSVYRTKSDIFQGAFWCKEKDVLVFVWPQLAPDLKTDFIEIGEPGKSGTTSIPEKVRECLEKRMDPGTVFWVVGNTENVPKVSEFKQAGQFVKGLLDDGMIRNVFDQMSFIQDNVKVFGMGVRLQQDLTFSGNFWATDIAAGRNLKNLIQKSMPNAKVFGPDKKEATKDPDQRWVSVQANLSDISVLLMDVMKTIKKE